MTDDPTERFLNQCRENESTDDKMDAISLYTKSQIDHMLHEPSMLRHLQFLVIQPMHLNAI